MSTCAICGKTPSDVEYNYISIKDGSQHVVCTADLERLLDALAELNEPNAAQ